MRLKTIRRYLFQTFVLGCVFLWSLSTHAPSFGQSGQPLLHEIASLAESVRPKLALPNPALVAKPLKIWECVSGWYGEPFDGQPTANGETYDMFALTAAHPTLPLGSLVRIISLANRRSQVVRINDRGPFVEGRDLDVSYQVARKLGFDQRGIARVRVELLEVPKRVTISDHQN
jgi:rare lipoprotein A (peptidoglycan hydrolase)